MWDREAIGRFDGRSCCINKIDDQRKARVRLRLPVDIAECLSYLDWFNWIGPTRQALFKDLKLFLFFLARWPISPCGEEEDARNIFNLVLLDYLLSLNLSRFKGKLQILANGVCGSG